MRTNLQIGLAGGVATLVLAAGSTIALAAANGGMGSRTLGPGFGSHRGPATAPSCTAPSLPGSVADVTLADMGGMMGGGQGGMMGGGQRGSEGMMRVFVTPRTVPAGTVSLRVSNVGWRTHELVVLPLADGARPGQRTVGPDREVSEDGSLGEASSTCAAGEGDGIASHSEGWVTLDLRPGRYELICNLPGHYSAGMYAELDVIS